MGSLGTSPGSLPSGGVWFSSWYVVSLGTGSTGHIAQSPQPGPRWSPAFKMEPVLSLSCFIPRKRITAEFHFGICLVLRKWLPGSQTLAPFGYSWSTGKGAGPWEGQGMSFSASFQPCSSVVCSLRWKTRWMNASAWTRELSQATPPSCITAINTVPRYRPAPAPWSVCCGSAPGRFGLGVRWCGDRSWAA